VYDGESGFDSSPSQRGGTGSEEEDGEEDARSKMDPVRRQIHLRMARPCSGPRTARQLLPLVAARNQSQLMTRVTLMVRFF
jgi:hypothetical protein